MSERVQGVPESGSSWAERSPWTVYAEQGPGFDTGRRAFISLTSVVCNQYGMGSTFSWQGFRNYWKCLWMWFNENQVAPPPAPSTPTDVRPLPSRCLWWLFGTGTFTCCPSSCSCSSPGTTSRSASDASAKIWWVQSILVKPLSPLTSSPFSYRIESQWVNCGDLFP